MKRQEKIGHPQGYDQNRLLDELIRRKALKNDAALCRLLQIAPPVISKVRHGKLKIGGDVMLRILEAFEMQISELRSLLDSVKVQENPAAALAPALAAQPSADALSKPDWQNAECAHDP